MLTTDSQAAVRWGNSVNIGIMKDNSVKTGKPGGGGGVDVRTAK